MYVGQWKEDYIEGNGELSSPDGTSYKGKYLSDLMELVVDLFFAGEWRGNKRHGAGTGE